MSDLLPKENFDFKFFGGIIKNADSGDIPVNSASASDNVDGSAPEGRLQGIPTLGSSISTTLGQDAKHSAWIKSSDGKWNLMYNATSAGKLLKDFYGTPTDSGLTMAVPTSFVVYNQECHCASTASTPYWVGYIPYTQWNGSAIGWHSVAMTLAQPAYTSNYTIAAVDGDAGDNFDQERTYEYNVSFVYDYAQETPMGTACYVNPQASIGKFEYFTVTTTIKSYASVNKRLTGVKLYRREVLAGSPVQRTFYKELQHFDVTNTSLHAYVGRTGANVDWVVSGSDMTVAFLDYNDIIGASYEDNTGMPETLTSSSFSTYGLNCQLNNYHFVAVCTKTGVPDANQMIFRSKPFRYDMFDWTTDFLKLSTQPTAMVAFQGRVWVFDENRCFRINPDSMIVEDVTEGIGCLSQRSIVVTDYGMFWCDAKNAYLHDGTNITPIGEAIKAETGEWHGFTRVETPIVIFDSLKNYVIFMISNSGGTTCSAWAYHVVKQRWDSWTSFATTSANMGMFVGKGGESYLSSGTNLYLALGGTSKRSWSWTSKNLDYGNASVVKRFYKLTSDPTTNVKKEYSLDGANFVDNATTALEKLNGKKLKLRLSTTTSAVYVDTCSHLFRRFEGNR